MWIRLYADGSQFSLTEQEREDGVTFDDVVDTEMMEGVAFREFPIAVTADLPTGDDVAVTAAHADVSAVSTSAA